MDANSVIQLIGSLGFPIVACIFLYRQNINIENKHHEEMCNMVESLNNNTLAITKLCDKLDWKEKNEQGT